MKVIVLIALLVLAYASNIDACRKYLCSCKSDRDCCAEKNKFGRKLRCLTLCDEGHCLPNKQCLFYAGIQKREVEDTTQCLCGKYLHHCTSNSDCCTQQDEFGRKLRCLTQCDEGGCLSYKQCLFRGGIQKK